jgi:arylsulfatase
MARRLAAVSLAGALAAGCGGPAPAGPHVLLVSIDTLRADRLGVYGHARDTSPRIDAFFAAGSVFERAAASAPCTLPSVQQYLAGAFDYSEHRKVLAEHLRDAGWTTAAIVSQQRFYHGLEGYRRGFDHFDIQARDAVDVHGESARTAREVSDRALAWLAANAGRPRLFLWLHYFDPHDPYEPPPQHRGFDAGNRSRKSGDPRSYQRAARPDASPRQALPGDLFDAEDVAHFRNLYDGEIRFVDAELGRVFDALDAHGLGERTIAVLLSDHGEWLGEEERWYHCLTLRDAEIHVPLLLRVNGGPLRGRARVAEPVSTLDVLPSVLSLLGLPYAEPEYHGVDLGRPPADRAVASLWARQLSLRSRDWTLVSENGSPRLLFAAADAEPRPNRIAEEPAVRDALARRSHPYQALRDAIRPERFQEALRAIGYLE